RSTLISDGRRQLVHLTLAGVGDIPIDQTSDLYQNFLLSLQTYGDPFVDVQVCLRKVRLLVISAGVQLQPAYDWDSVEPRIRASVLALFSFDARDLGQPAFLSEAIAAIQAVEGVLYVNVTTFDSVSDDITVDQLAKLASTLKLRQAVRAHLARLDPNADLAGDPCRRIRAAELAYLTPNIAFTWILSNLGVWAMACLKQDPDRLYALVPTVYRLRDADQGYPLKALLRVIAEQVNVVEQDIAGLYENWFIETCQDWVVPYIGDLVGYQIVHEAGEPGDVTTAEGRLL